MTSNNNRISRKKFLDIWKGYDQFEIVELNIEKEVLENGVEISYFKGCIRAFMKTNNKNNNKLDYIIQQIEKINTRIDKIDIQIEKVNTQIDNMHVEFNNRFDKIESCPTIRGHLNGTINKEVSQWKKENQSQEISL